MFVFLAPVYPAYGFVENSDEPVEKTILSKLFHREVASLAFSIFYLIL